jgi:TPR repeat protein
MKTGMKQRLIAPVRLAAVCVGLWQTHGLSVQAQAVPTVHQAAQAYHAGQYQLALTLYEQLAQQGNAEAAERAGFMLLQANGHYGVQVRRDVDRAHALITQAARANRAAASFMLNMLENTD